MYLQIFPLTAAKTVKPVEPPLTVVHLYTSFRPPPSATDPVDEWCERAAFVVDDLEFLLGLEHHKFWDGGLLS